MSINFTGPAKRIDDIDLPRIGAEIGVGEDPIHALIEVETSGSGFDRHGRPKMLFEPHKFYKHLSKDPEKRARAVRQGLAYREWGTQKYPKDSYARLAAAMEIDEHAALMSASWGLGQIMGENYRLAGYKSVEEMVQAFTEDEDNHLEAMIHFVKASGIDDDLRRIEQKIRRKEKITIADVVPIVRTYNGAGYKRNRYDTRFLTALNRWIKIKNTPYVAGANMKEIAEAESAAHEVVSAADVEVATEIDETEKTVDEAKGVTTGTETSTQTSAEGSPPPTPAAEIIASRPSLKSTAAAVLAFLMAPLSYLGIDLKQVGDFAKSNIALAVKLAFVFGLIVLAYHVWNKAMERANQRTLKLMDAAAEKEKNNLRLV